MKGIIFNLLESVVINAYGEDTWDDLLAESEIDGVYTSLGSYPDENLQTLVATAARRLGQTQFDVLRWFGQQAMPLLHARYPGFFDAQPSLRPFLLSVNTMIHPEVLKIYPNASVPVFDFRDDPDGGLLMGYRSPRRLCALLQGLVEGGGKHFGEPIVFEHRSCMLNGDESCLCHVSFAPDQAPTC
jgi:Haem-NO-binding